MADEFDEHDDTLSIAMHWLMFLLLVGVYSCIELRELYPKGSDPREAFKTWHFTLGLTVFVLVWIRLTLRLSQVTPAIEPQAPAWQNTLAALFHHYRMRDNTLLRMLPGRRVAVD